MCSPCAPTETRLTESAHPRSESSLSRRHAQVVVLGPYTSPSQDSYSAAVAVKPATGFAWVQRLPDLQFHTVFCLVREIHEAVLARMEWAPGVLAATHFSFASAISFPLPLHVITHHYRGGSPLTFCAVLSLSPSSGSFLASAEIGPHSPASASTYRPPSSTLSSLRPAIPMIWDVTITT